jgi:hypothetical protein
MTSPSHGGGPEFESQRAHPDSPDIILMGFDPENTSKISLSITFEALLPVFLRRFISGGCEVGVFKGMAIMMHELN